MVGREKAYAIKKKEAKKKRTTYTIKKEEAKKKREELLRKKEGLYLRRAILELEKNSVLSKAEAKPLIRKFLKTRIEEFKEKGIPTTKLEESLKRVDDIITGLERLSEVKKTRNKIEEAKNESKSPYYYRIKEFSGGAMGAGLVSGFLNDIMPILYHINELDPKNARIVNASHGARDLSLAVAAGGAAAYALDEAYGKAKQLKAVRETEEYKRIKREEKELKRKTKAVKKKLRKTKKT